MKSVPLNYKNPIFIDIIRSVLLREPFVGKSFTNQSFSVSYPSSHTSYPTFGASYPTFGASYRTSGASYPLANEMLPSGKVHNFPTHKLFLFILKIASYNILIPSLGYFFKVTYHRAWWKYLRGEDSKILQHGQPSITINRQSHASTSSSSRSH